MNQFGIDNRVYDNLENRAAAINHSIHTVIKISTNLLDCSVPSNRANIANVHISNNLSPQNAVQFYDSSLTALETDLKNQWDSIVADIKETYPVFNHIYIGTSGLTVLKGAIPLFTINMSKVNEKYLKDRFGELAIPNSTIQPYNNINPVIEKLNRELVEYNFVPIIRPDTSLLINSSC